MDLHSVIPLFTKQYLLPKFDSMQGRYFRVTPSGNEWLVETISGGSLSMAQASRHPNGCGYLDSFPPQDALVRQRILNSPKGLGAFVNSSTDYNKYHLSVADRNNHVVRSISSVCSFICENDGRCVGPNQCLCRKG